MNVISQSFLCTDFHLHLHLICTAHPKSSISQPTLQGYELKLAPRRGQHITRHRSAREDRPA
jgi:hypothetical protein